MSRGKEKTAPDLIVGRQSHTITKRDTPRGRGLLCLYDLPSVALIM